MRANGGKVGAPHQYAETLIMPAAGVRAAQGVRHRQLQGMIGKVIGRSDTPVFGQMHKRITGLDADMRRGPDGMVTVSGKKGSRMLALDASGLKRHNRGEWMRAEWKVRRGFVKMHVPVDTETMRILAPGVTDDSVGDPAMLESLLGQVADADGAGTGGGARSTEPPAAPRFGGGPRYKNLLASGVPPLASFFPGAPRNPAAPDLLPGDAAYGSRKNAAACARAGVTPGIAHAINVAARGKGSGDARGMSVRDQMGGSPGATRPGLMGREEKRENQAYWKARTGYGHRWLAEAVFSAFKRLFGEHPMAPEWENIVQEVRLKAVQYNKWRDESMAREASRMA